MGELKLSHISAILFEHMIIGMIFYTHPGMLTLEKVERISKEINIAKLQVSVAIVDLVSHGIISAAIQDAHSISYEITEFGQYFFNRVCQTNEDAKELYEKVGGYTV